MGRAWLLVALVVLLAVAGDGSQEEGDAAFHATSRDQHPAPALSASDVQEHQHLSDVEREHLMQHIALHRQQHDAHVKLHHPESYSDSFDKVCLGG
jgi:hypothetical protein